ncbi:unnamed protein product [Mytilus edulis]|uniref:Uncharacterized protein n=1 Tax=Mytilus edulis TaxID=6550 RepID=A0A8S3RNS9_MYTED|nr:unnamed protein product [Mytilus edulis]
MKGRRLGPFQTTSGPMHIRPEVDNKTKRPSPASYNITKPTGRDAPSASFKGSRPKSLFGEPVRPGPGQSDVPGPGNYHISQDVMENESPAYSMRQQLKAVENDVPAPNKYEYEKKRIERGSKFSMGKRFTMPNSMKDSPGPGTYSPKQLKCSPKFSMKGRTPIISKNGNIPAPIHTAYLPRLNWTTKSWSYH